MLLFTLGWFALLLGVIGVILPVMPTAPFLIIAAACFARSSAAMYRRVIEMPLIGKYIDDYYSGRGIPRRVKWFSIAGVWTTVLAGLLFFVKEVWAKIVLLIIGVAATLSLLLAPSSGRAARLRKWRRRQSF